MYDVMFYEAFKEERCAIQACCSDYIKAGFSEKTIQEAMDDTPPAPIISVRTQSKIPVQWASSLKGILSRTSGYDNLASYFKTSKSNVSCGYLPRYCVRAVAEQAMLLWTALLRKLPLQLSQFDRFHRDGITGRECLNKTLLVVGVGNIGHEISMLGQALGMQTLGVDIVKRHENIRYIAIEEGIPLADIIVCAMNLTETNNGYFSYELLKNAKKGVIFINVSRGECSPSVDLLRLLKEGVFGGIGMDVYNEEGNLAVGLREGKIITSAENKATLELRKYPQVMFTPHNAFNTEEALERKASQSIMQLQHFLKNNNTFLWPIPCS